MKRLNIFVDETGEFGFGKGSSQLYGVSFTFHEHSNNISDEINKLNNHLNKIGYDEMIHMANLVTNRAEYKKLDLKKRKSIFNAIYQFSRKIPVSYQTIIIDKRYTDKSSILRKQLSISISNMIVEHKEYFKKFDKIVMYYDNGQEELGVILDNQFNQFDTYEHRIDFNHKEKRLFQVSDMLTYIDKYDYKYKNKMKFSKSEMYFLSNKEIRKILKELNKKRF